MGDSGAMTATGFHLNWETGYFLVNQSFNTSFAQGQAQEEFVWLVGDDNHPLLQTYRIDAPQFH